MKTANPQHEENLQHQQNPQETTHPQGNPEAGQQPKQTVKDTTCDSAQSPLNERPKNLLESWQRLREMDINLAQNKNNDMPAGDKPAQREEHL